MTRFAAGICPGFARQRLHPWLCSQLTAGLLSRRLSHRSDPDAGLPHQDRGEVRPEAPECSGERSLILLTKDQHVGTSLLAAAIASSEQHWSHSEGEVDFEGSPPSNDSYTSIGRWNDLAPSLRSGESVQP